MTIPEVGRSVHYLNQTGPQPIVCRAAVTTVKTPDNGTVPNMTIFNPAGMQFATNVAYDPTRTIVGTWHYPCNQYPSTVLLPGA
jgi:hypothetical protein